MSKLINFRADDGQFTPAQLAQIESDRFPGAGRLLAAAARKVFAAPTPRILGCDVSKWQGDTNFVKMKAAGAEFVYIKASQDIRTDSKFDRNWRAARAAGLPFGLYHFADPAYHSADEQAIYFANRIAEARPELGVVLDLERDGGLTPLELSRWGERFETTLWQINEYAEIYTRDSFWTPSVIPGTWAGAYPLWIARYAEYLDGPWADGRYKPADWSDWWMWQFSADGNGRGAEFGAESASIDLNYMQCTVAEMRYHYGLDDDPPPDCPPCVDELEDVMTAVLTDFDAAIVRLDERVTALESNEPPPEPGRTYPMVVSTNGTDLMLRRTVPSGEIIARMPNGSPVTVFYGMSVPDTNGRGTWEWVEYNGSRGYCAGWLLAAPDAPVETMTVTVTADKLRVETVCGHDSACSGKSPPGKPVIEPDPDIQKYMQGEKITVFARAAYSCMDAKNTPTIKASGSDDGKPRLYYRIAAGLGVDARFSPNYPAGGYIDKDKVLQ